jgi:hypothetical protein
VWPLIDAIPPGLPHENRGLVWADRPWDGYYRVTPLTWVIAQTTQFTAPGWRYADGANGTLPAGGSYDTYLAPVRSAWSMGAQTSMAAAAQHVAVRVYRYGPAGLGSLGYFTGLGTVDEDMPFAGTELAWRLARPAWGHGYATEAALAAMNYGFAAMGLPEIIAVTMTANLRSQAVMRRIGMITDPAEDFDDPDVAEDPLRRHVVYRKGR